LQVVESVGLGVSVMSDSKVPEVIFAGNFRLRERVQAMLGDYANVQMADNVRPSLETEQLDDAVRMITKLYEELKINNLSGVQELRDWSSYPILPTAHAFKGICHYFAALQKQTVLGVDLGSNSVSLVLAEPEQAQVAIPCRIGHGVPGEPAVEQKFGGRGASVGANGGVGGGNGRFHLQQIAPPLHRANHRKNVAAGAGGGPHRHSLCHAANGPRAALADFGRTTLRRRRLACCWRVAIPWPMRPVLARLC
jgi:hypothetical protein